MRKNITEMFLFIFLELASMDLYFSLGVSISLSQHQHQYTVLVDCCVWLGCFKVSWKGSKILEQINGVQGSFECIISLGILLFSFFREGTPYPVLHNLWWPSSNNSRYMYYVSVVTSQFSLDNRGKPVHFSVAVVVGGNICPLHMLVNQGINCFLPITCF